MGIVVKVLFVLLLMIVIASFAFKEIKDVIPAKTLIWIKVISVIPCGTFGMLLFIL